MLDGGGFLTRRLTLGNDPVPFVQAPEPVWTGAENLVRTGIRFPDRPARTGLLYRLNYLGRFCKGTFALRNGITARTAKVC